VRLAYLINVHPAPSHTFIRREIAALRQLGLDPLLISLRAFPGPLPDPQDVADRERTYVVQAGGTARLLVAALGEFAAQPIRCSRVLVQAVRRHAAAGNGMLRPLTYFLQACVVRRWLARNCSDHVHVHMGSNAAAVAQIARALGGPNYSLTLHGPEEFDEPGRWCLADKLADATFVVAVSEGRLEQLSAAYPGVGAKLHLIRCGIDADFRRVGAEPPAVPDCARFLAVGRLCERKNHRALVEAVDQARRVRDDIRLTIIGDGPLHKPLAQLIHQRRLADHVTLLGTLDSRAVARHITAARALVVPSYSETLPCVILEAFALHRPVICAAVGSHSELVRHKVNGWLLAEAAAEPLTAALLEALATPVNQLTAMGARGARTIEQEYASERQAAKLLDLFERYVVGRN
jgi:glycosyltransferase involved in cell wall biosynthesis